VLAAYAPLLLAIRQPDSGLVFGAFFQCTILAYFFFSAWRGLRAQGGFLQWAWGAFWLALSLGFIYAWSLSGSMQRVAEETLTDASSDVRAELMAGDTVLVRAIDGAPRTGDLVLVRSESDKEPPHWQRVSPEAKPDQSMVLGAVTWRVWSDGAALTDAPVAFYTKARWDRFPQRIR
jgi:hypothetical protein